MAETALPPDNGFHATEPEADSAVRSVPEDALANISAVAQEVGGAYRPLPAIEGAVAFTHFDTPSSEDNAITILMAKEHMDRLPSQTLVCIDSLNDNHELDRSYLGTVLTICQPEETRYLQETGQALPQETRPTGIPRVLPELDEGAVLYLQEQGSYVGKRSEHLVVSLEGQAASAYFGAFGRMLHPAVPGEGFDFRSRNRRRPRDPVNTLLSFGYAMLAKDTFSAPLTVGFDPYLGFYHGGKHGGRRWRWT
jgi:CRISPR associated protein Cas1